MLIFEIKVEKTEEVLDGVSTIKLVVEWQQCVPRGRINATDDHVQRARNLKVVSEGLLKFSRSVDAVGLGESQLQPEVPSLGYFKSVEFSIITFLFHYASRGRHAPHPALLDMHLTSI